MKFEWSQYFNNSVIPNNRVILIRRWSFPVKSSIFKVKRSGCRQIQLRFTLPPNVKANFPRKSQKWTRDTHASPQYRKNISYRGQGRGRGDDIARNLYRDLSGTMNMDGLHVTPIAQRPSRTTITVVEITVNSWANSIFRLSVAIE